jgi:hypothetical protein
VKADKTGLSSRDSGYVRSKTYLSDTGQGKELNNVYLLVYSVNNEVWTQIASTILSVAEILLLVGAVLLGSSFPFLRNAVRE